MNNLIEVANATLEAKNQASLRVMDGQGNPEPQKEEPTWKNALIRSKEGAIKEKSVSNVSLIIEHDPYLAGKFRKNEFTGLVEISTINIPGPTTQHDKEQAQRNGRYIREVHLEAGELRDDVPARIREYLEQKWHILFSAETVRSSITNLAGDPGNTINPIKQRIESTVWDHKPRMENYFIKYLEAERSGYTKEVTRTWFMGLMDRLYRPGGKFEVVPILEGEQGIGKSTVASQLCPDYFTDSLSTLGEAKDDYLTVGSNWIIELGELSSMNATTTEKVKNFISAQKDDIRDPYGHQPYPHKRKCVFIGTTNEHKYLKDETGNRRFYPIRCLRKRADGPITATKDDIAQVLAEAKWRYDEAVKNGELSQKLTVAPEYREIATKKQREAKADNPIENTLDAYLSLLIPSNWDKWTYTSKRAYFEHFTDPANGFDKSDENTRKAALRAYIGSDRSPLFEEAKGSDLKRMVRVQTEELLVVALDMKNQSAKGKTESRILKRLMANKEGWKASRFRVNGSNARGYIYTKDIQEGS